MKILNLGCGRKQFPDALNVDRCHEVSPDVVWNLDHYPWPFCFHHYDKVIALDIFEHVIDSYAFMEAIWKVLVKDGIVEIRTSYWQSPNSFRDSTHRRFCTLETFDDWDDSTDFGKKYGYQTGKIKFKILKKESSGQELVFILQKMEV